MYVYKIYLRVNIYIYPHILSVLWRVRRETLFHHFPGKSAVSTFYTILTHIYKYIYDAKCGVLQTTTGPLKNEHRPKPINQTTTRVRDPQTIRLHHPSTDATRNRLDTIYAIIYSGYSVPTYISINIIYIYIFVRSVCTYIHT